MLSLPEGSFKWLGKIEEILTSVGRLDLCVNQFLIEQKNIHKGVKQILIDQFKQNWHDQLQQSNKGKIYSNFKMTHEFEDYLTQLNRREYLQLFKFRTANHLLPIEAGRYDGILWKIEHALYITQTLLVQKYTIFFIALFSTINVKCFC